MTLWNPLRAWLDERRQDRLMHLQAIQAIRDAAVAQARAFEAYFESLKVSEPPVSRVMREEDEWRREQEALAAQGDQTAREYLAWIAKSAD